MRIPKSYWRFSYDSQSTLEQMLGTNTLVAPRSGVQSTKYVPETVVAVKMRIGDGVFLGRFDPDLFIGNIVAIGVAEDEKPTVRVRWKPIQKQVHPNRQGGTEPWASRCFKFAGAPAERYGLAQLFAEHFSAT